MIVIADNDIIVKLAACDLFGELLRAFSATPAGVLTLDTARHTLLQKRFHRQLGDDGFQRMEAFLKSAQIITAIDQPDEIDALIEFQNIDDGEAILFSVAKQTGNSILATGDKRSLIALSEAADRTCENIRTHLAGRVFCFEQILVRIMDAVTFEAVRDKLVRGRECDKALRLIIGSGLSANEATLREGLQSYIGHLRKLTGSLLDNP